MNGCERASIRLARTPTLGTQPLTCPFCYIRQRKNLTVYLDLHPEQLPIFVVELADHEPIREICIQGYEPPDLNSPAYIRAILGASYRLGIPVKLATNELHLGRWMDELAVLLPAPGLDKVAVSIDAGDAASHDEHRGFPGAFHAAVRRLQPVAIWLGGKTDLLGNSIVGAAGKKIVEAIIRYSQQG